MSGNGWAMLIASVIASAITFAFGAWINGSVMSKPRCDRDEIALAARAVAENRLDDLREAIEKAAHEHGRIAGYRAGHEAGRQMLASIVGSMKLDG